MKSNLADRDGGAASAGFQLTDVSVERFFFGVSALVVCTLDLDQKHIYNFDMLKGYNTDLNVRGQSYHVQTEDWGTQNPFLVTRIFKNGAVLKTVKVSHQDALYSGPALASDGLERALRVQHQRILDQLMSGSFS